MLLFKSTFLLKVAELWVEVSEKCAELWVKFQETWGNMGSILEKCYKITRLETCAYKMNMQIDLNFCD